MQKMTKNRETWSINSLARLALGSVAGSPVASIFIISRTLHQRQSNQNSDFDSSTRMSKVTPHHHLYQL